MQFELILVLGGARSGKSRHAEGLVSGWPSPWTYLATAELRDAEMTARAAEHRARRGRGWHVIEEPNDLAGALDGLEAGVPALVDCLTLWLGNRMEAAGDLDADFAALQTALARRRGPVVLVANEVGLGIVPANAFARRFRDAAGLLNQRIAAAATRVDFIAAGLALRLK